MSSFDPHKDAQGPGRAAEHVVARGRYSRAHFQALEDLKKHLGEMEDDRAGAASGVHGMQDKVAAFSAALAADRDDSRGKPRASAASKRDQAWREWTRSDQTRLYEERIAQGLADLSALLAKPQRPAPRDEHTQHKMTLALDAPSQKWIAQHFARLRERLDATLDSDKSELDASEVLKRVAALELKLDEMAARQVRGGRELLSTMDVRLGEFSRVHLAKIAARTDIEKLESRLNDLHEHMEGSKHAISLIKRDSEKLAIRTGAAVARQTAALTAKRVAADMKLTFPVARLDRLESRIGICVEETRSLSTRTEMLQKSLDEGVSDLRNRVSLLIAATPRGHSSLRERIEQKAIIGEDDVQPERPAKAAAHADWISQIEDEFDGEQADRLEQHVAAADRPAPKVIPQAIRPDAIRDRHFAYEFNRRQQRDRANRLALVGVGLVAALLAAAGCLWLYAQLSQPKAVHSALTSSAVELTRTTIIVKTPAHAVYRPGMTAFSAPPGPV